MQPHSSSLRPLSALQQMSCSIAKNGPTSELLSSLSSLCLNSPIVSDGIWNDLKKDTAEDSSPRKVDLKQWSSKPQLQDQDSRSYRAAWLCLDFLYSIVAADDEKAFIMAKLVVEENHAPTKSESTSVLGACSLALNYDPSENVGAHTEQYEQQYSLVQTFVKDLSELSKDIPCAQSDWKWQFVLDVTVNHDHEKPTSKVDANEIACIAIITAHILLKVIDVPHELSFVKMITGTHYSTPVLNNAVTRIFANWPDVPPDNLSKVRALVDEFEAKNANADQIVKEVSLLTIGTETCNILLIGRTGSGKSHTGNWILENLCSNSERRFLESSSGSMTSNVERLPVRNSWISVWDTPGLDDSHGQDGKYLDEIRSIIMEIGTIHAVIICFETAHRIDARTQANIATYKRIVGPEMANHIMLVVNQQPIALRRTQKKSLINAMRKHASLDVPDSHVYDLGPHADNLGDIREEALKTLKKLCEGKPFKASYFDRLQKGLLEIENLRDPEEFRKAQDILVHLSEEALVRKLQHPSRQYPLHVQKTRKNAIYLSDGFPRRLNDGEKRYVTHVLHMPDTVMKSFLLRTWEALLRMRRKPNVSFVRDLARKERLVFLELPADERQEPKNGLIWRSCKLHYQMWDIESALTNDMKANLRKAIGDDFKRTVSAFQSLREES